MQPESKRQSAFTVVEVMLALMLFALSAVVLGAAYLNVLNSYERVRQNQALEEDLRFVRSMVLLEADRDEVERGGEIESLYLGRMSWRTYLEQTAMPDLFEVTLEIDYEGPDMRQGQQEIQRFFLFRPSWADGSEQDRGAVELERRLKERREFRDR